MCDSICEYSWDARDLLVEVKTRVVPAIPAGARVRIVNEYDAFGRRVVKKVYRWDSGAENVLSTFSGLAQPRDWVGWVNEPRRQAELESLRMAIAKGRPFGQEDWRRLMIQTLGLESSLRPPGRPGKQVE